MKQIELRLTDGEHTNPVKNSVRFPSQVYDVFASLKDKASETLLVIYLSEDYTGIYDVHSTGASAMVTLDLHDLFGRAYLTRSRYMILVHNHPKGDPSPSPADLEALEAIRLMAAPMDARRLVGLLDFVIIGDDSYWSWAEENGITGYEEV